MGKDNSSSKSELRLQLDKTNELLKKTEKTLEEAQRKLKEEKQKNEDKNIILETFLNELVNVEKPNVLLLEHDFSTRIAPYLTREEINGYNELLNYKEGAPEEIEKILTKKMTQYINGILDELNQMTGLEFFLENRREVTFRLENVDKRRLEINTLIFKFIVNIR